MIQVVFNDSLVVVALAVIVFFITMRNNEDVLLVWLTDHISLAVILHN